MRVDMICEANSIEHRLTKPNHPWSCEDQKTVRGTVFPNNGQGQRMNRTVKDATVKCCKIWTSKHNSFTLKPIKQMPRLKIYV